MKGVMVLFLLKVRYTCDLHVSVPHTGVVFVHVTDIFVLIPKIRIALTDISFVSQNLSEHLSFGPFAISNFQF